MNWDKNRKTHIKRWLRRRTLIYIANNSVGSKMWAKSFILDSDDKVHDLYEDGNLSCAYHVSTTLKMCELWKDQAVGNVGSLVDKLPQNGWYQIDSPRPGAIIVYGRNLLHRAWATMHIGIIVGEDEVISNGSNDSHIIRRHPINYTKLKSGQWREIEGYWWHPDFEDDDLLYAPEEVFTRKETPEHQFEA
jgi:hypothetical protein